jgi:hypothetical protein
LSQTLDLLEDAAAALTAEQDLSSVDGGATAFLRLAQLAASGWIAARLAALQGDDPANRRLVAAGRHWLNGLAPRAALAHAEAKSGGAMIEGFAALQ